MRENDLYCLEHDADIEQEIAVHEVVEIVLPLLGGVAYGASVAEFDLCPAREAWRDRAPEVVVGNLFLELGHELRLFRSRADECHVTFEHVPELRHFVDVQLA